MLRACVYAKLISNSKPHITSSCLCSLYLKRGSASGGREEGRAPSTAEEFTRQGVASQTVEKAYGAESAANVSSDSEEGMEKVRKEFQEKEESREYYHKKGNVDDDDEGLPINTSKGT